MAISSNTKAKIFRWVEAIIGASSTFVLVFCLALVLSA